MKISKEVVLEQQRQSIADQTAAFLAKKGNSITQAEFGESAIDESNSRGLTPFAHSLRVGRLLKHFHD